MSEDKRISEAEAREWETIYEAAIHGAFESMSRTGPPFVTMAKKAFPRLLAEHEEMKALLEEWHLYGCMHAPMMGCHKDCPCGCHGGEEEQP